MRIETHVGWRCVVRATWEVLVDAKKKIQLELVTRSFFSIQCHCRPGFRVTRSLCKAHLPLGIAGARWDVEIVLYDPVCAALHVCVHARGLCSLDSQAAHLKCVFLEVWNLSL